MLYNTTCQAIYILQNRSATGKVCQWKYTALTLLSPSSLHPSMTTYHHQLRTTARYHLILHPSRFDEIPTAARTALNTCHTDGAVVTEETSLYQCFILESFHESNRLLHFLGFRGLVFEPSPIIKVLHITLH